MVLLQNHRCGRGVVESGGRHDVHGCVTSLLFYNNFKGVFEPHRNLILNGSCVGCKDSDTVKFQIVGRIR